MGDAVTRDVLALELFDAVAGNDVERIHSVQVANQRLCQTAREISQLFVRAEILEVENCETLRSEARDRRGSTLHQKLFARPRRAGEHEQRERSDAGNYAPISLLRP